MKSLKRRKIFLLLAAVMLMPVLVSGTACAAVGREDRTVYDYTDVSGWPELPELAAQSVYMIELSSGAVLANVDGDAISYPASTTKIMTALLALENCDLDDEVTLSHNAIYDIEDGGHNWDFQEGEVLSVDECLQFLMVQSVNEVANALAEHISGSLSDFSSLMNERAAELGATNTHFNNPHGLNDENHTTTAHDMAMILWGCIQDERFQQYASIQSISLKGRAIKTDGFPTYTNHHLMLLPSADEYDSDVVCGKTGYTSIAGNTLVTYAKRGDMDVICVLMKGGTGRFTDTKSLLDYAFDNFELVSADEALAAGIGSAVLPMSTVGDEEGVILLPKNTDLTQLTTEFTLKDSGEANSTLGMRTWSWQGKVIGSSTVTMAAVDDSKEVQGDGDEASAASQEKQEETLTEEKALNGISIKEIGVFVILGVLLIVLVLLLISLLKARARRRRRKRRRERYRRR